MSDQYVIQQGNPIPEEPRKNTPKYPFKDMNIGDSVDVDSWIEAKGANAHAQSSGKKFISRRQDAENGGKIRVWRTE